MLVASGIRHPNFLMHLAITYALQGRDDAALDMLGKAVDYHAFPFDLPGIRFQDWYDPFGRLKDNPRYQALERRAKGDIGRQVENIRAMLAEQDLDQLLVPIMPRTEKAVAEAK